jgi:hypothetical protein
MSSVVGYNFVTYISDYRRGLNWLIGFIYHLKVVTTNNYNTIVDFHTTNHSTLSLLSMLSQVFTW